MLNNQFFYVQIFSLEKKEGGLTIFLQWNENSFGIHLYISLIQHLHLEVKQRPIDLFKALTLLNINSSVEIVNKT